MLTVQHEPEAVFFWDIPLGRTMDNYLLQRELTFIRKFVNGKAAESKILEIGCGSGRITLPLSRLGLNIGAMDFNAAPLKSFQQKSKAVSLVRGDATHLPFSDDSLDYVLAIQTLLNFDHESFLAECKRILKDEGLLICQFLNRQSYKWLLKKLFNGKQTLNGYSSLGYNEFLHAVAKYDFEVQALSGYNWLPFDRHSNSNWVNTASRLEALLHLDRLRRISPWVLVAARKKSSG
jgi:ubiquinone/menaquinone biosynthesis C-methylase UbiE